MNYRRPLFSMTRNAQICFTLISFLRTLQHWPSTRNNSNKKNKSIVFISTLHNAGVVRQVVDNPKLKLETRVDELPPPKQRAEWASATRQRLLVIRANKCVRADTFHKHVLQMCGSNRSLIVIVKTFFM